MTAAGAGSGATRRAALEAAALTDLASPSGAARDSMRGGLWTAVSRITGVVRVIVIGAVLGPTFFANAYQLTNSFPNLVYYGFLAGSLFSSLLVPALVAYIDDRDPTSVARLAGGFLGVALCGLIAVAPFAIAVLPPLISASSGTASVGAEQQELARLLVVLVIPQLLLYAVAGACSAVMIAHRRFALAAASPAMENLGIIVMLIVFARMYGVEHADLANQTSGEVLLLGVGSTAAVGLNAGLQWWGARRMGVTLIPAWGWRDPDVVVVLKRAMRSMAQAAMLALQMLVVLLVVNRVNGGTVTMQIALNFYFLPIAVVATPVALALLPRLSRMAGPTTGPAFADTFGQGLGLALFVVVPAAVGYAVLAQPLAHLVAVGQMDTAHGVSMIAEALSVLALGLAGETVFLVATQAFYARKDTRRPLQSMGVQLAAFTALIICVVAMTPGNPVLGAAVAYAVASLVGAAHLMLRLRTAISGSAYRLSSSILASVVAAAVMAGPVFLVAQGLSHVVPGRLGALLAVLVGAGVGVVVYGLTAAALRMPQLWWVLSAVRARTMPAPDWEVSP